MKRLIAVLWMISTLAVGIVWAQSFPPNEAGVTMGHWHLNTRDIEANKKIFVAMGGTAIKSGNFELVKFPGVAMYLHLNQGAPAPTGFQHGHADGYHQRTGARSHRLRRQEPGSVLQETRGVGHQAGQALHEESPDRDRACVYLRSLGHIHRVERTA